MAWFFLILAGLFEIGWPLGLKIAQKPEYRVAGFVMAVGFMLGSGALLWLAQKTIPMGTAYAVWTGIGAVGAFITGAILFGDPLNALRVVSIVLIVAGVVGLKFAHGAV